MSGSTVIEASILWIFRKKKPSAILPLIIVRSPLRGCSLVALPFRDEAVCEDANIALKPYQEAVRQFQGQRADSLDLYLLRPRMLEISSAGSKVTLADDPGRMWYGFNAKLCNRTRLAQKSAKVEAFARQ